MSRPPQRFRVGEVVEALTTAGSDGWGRIVEADWLLRNNAPTEPPDPYDEDAWYYRLEGHEWWYPEVNLRKLSTIEVMAFESRRV